MFDGLLSESMDGLLEILLIDIIEVVLSCFLDLRGDLL